MISKEILSKIRKLEIHTKGLVNNIFSGEYQSAFKGRGMEFSEVRAYTFGDDVRQIDWNVTARSSEPYIKVFEEERELTVMLLVDVSGSRDFGTHVQLKKNLITEVSAVLSFSAIQNNDKIGVIFFSDKIEKFIPPKKGRQHILRIIRELIEFQPEQTKTNISEALRYLTNVIKKRCTAFVLSDFFEPDFEDALRIANNKHDIVALRIYDKREQTLPPVGLVRFTDAETNEDQWVDTLDENNRREYERWWMETTNKLKTIFSKSGVDNVALATDEDYVKPLLKLFKRR